MEQEKSEERKKRDIERRDAKKAADAEAREKEHQGRRAAIAAKYAEKAAVKGLDGPYRGSVFRAPARECATAMWEAPAWSQRATSRASTLTRSTPGYGAARSTSHYAASTASSKMKVSDKRSSFGSAKNKGRSSFGSSALGSPRGTTKNKTSQKLKVGDKQCKNREFISDSDDTDGEDEAHEPPIQPVKRNTTTIFRSTGNKRKLSGEDDEDDVPISKRRRTASNTLALTMDGASDSARSAAPEYVFGKSSPQMRKDALKAVRAKSAES